ncbi:hypothetical protein BVC80_1329g13 [Macleaya cordata]|uniref:Embryo defective 1273 n=1 Tax=Macleaya cordata TaxID=56857 RepID=A0A200PPJ2_MACCD|nr:hypothetical protein BVC80_1329g13 [Macleaya cordata]
MALTASTVPSFGFQIKLLEGQIFPAHWCSHFSRFPNHRTPIRCSMKISTVAQFGEPSKLKMQVDDFGEKLWQSFPEPVKEFPWKKAEDVVLQRFLFLGERVLKWSMVALFVLSSLSDVMLSISRNRELLIPLGLFVGCMLADFLKETSKELLPSTKEGGLKRHLVVTGAFFVLVKVSAYFTIGGNLLLSHVGNGGLMQVLWLWIKSHEERGNDDTSTGKNMEN